MKLRIREITKDKLYAVELYHGLADYWSDGIGPYYNTLEEANKRFDEMVNAELLRRNPPKDIIVREETV